VFESNENVKTALARTPRSGFVQPGAAANGGIASLLQSTRLVAAVAELGSLGLMSTVKLHEHNFPKSEWPFLDPENSLAISTVQVFRQGLPILQVSHDYDGDWQVLCSTTSDVKDGIVVCLGCAYERDKTIAELADLPRGWTAWRDYVGGPWQREQNPPDEDEG